MFAFLIGMMFRLSTIVNRFDSFQDLRAEIIELQSTNKGLEEIKVNQADAIMEMSKNCCWCNE